jgi:hypothetical protein
MWVNRTDFAATLILAEALLWSEMAVFEHTVYALDCNFNPTGFTLPPGKYPFIPRDLVPRWDEDQADDAMAVALWELGQPNATDGLRKGKFPPEFGGRMLIRVQQGFVLLIGAGAARVVKPWPTTTLAKESK